MKARKQKHEVEPTFGLIAHPVFYYENQNAKPLTSLVMLSTRDTVINDT